MKLSSGWEIKNDSHWVNGDYTVMPVAKWGCPFSHQILYKGVHLRYYNGLEKALRGAERGLRHRGKRDV